MFLRKAYLNKWNYFITITNNGTRTEDEFRIQLKKCFSNLNVRKGWKIMGVFERAPETSRLHFHGIANIPEDEMMGKITKISDYSTIKHQRQERQENSFFKKFGVNDFQYISQINNCVNYILKYITKDNERIFYSRGIRSCFLKIIPNKEIITSYFDYIEKYVLYDEFIDYDYDLLHINKQTEIG